MAEESERERHAMARRGRLTSRPGGSAANSPGPGLHTVELAGRQGALLYVPPGGGDAPAPLAVLLHGAGSSARRGIDLLLPLSDVSGLFLLAPGSVRETWDVLLGGFGPDVAALDRALAWTFARCDLDPARLAIGGFSDGASYALSLGLTNGDLFSHVLAFAPGFVAPGDLEGRPRIFVAHGTRDQVLPIERCSRRIVPQLERASYAVRYREFDGPHTVPPEIAREGLAWFLAPSVDTTVK